MNHLNIRRGFMKKFIILCLAFLQIACNACIFHMNGFGVTAKGSGNIINDSRELTDFHTVEIVGRVDADITSGESFSCNVQGDDNLVPLVKMTVTNNTLEISTEGNYSTKNPLIVYLTMPVLDKAKIIGSGDMTISDVTKDKVILTITGSGDITSSGSVGILEAVVSGSGDLSLRNLQADHVNVTINGSGDAEVWAKQSISAQVNGSGDIVYTGNPGKVDTQVNGSGDITKR